MVERTGWFIFKRTKTKVDAPIGTHTVTLSSSNPNSAPPWSSTEFYSGDGDGGYSVTCMTVPYRSSNGITFKVYKSKQSAWMRRLFPSQGIKVVPAFDNGLMVKGSNAELVNRLFSYPELRQMLSGCLGCQHASSWIIKTFWMSHYASNHGWAWMESTIVKHIGDETLNELQLVYEGTLEDTELLLRFHQLLTKTMESLSTIGCAIQTPEPAGLQTHRLTPEDL